MIIMSFSMANANRVLGGMGQDSRWIKLPIDRLLVEPLVIILTVLI